MVTTIKCSDCGHTERSEAGASKTCPQCEGKMTAPSKKKYQAKSTALEEEARAKKKEALSLDDDEDEKPKRKPKPRKAGESPVRDGAAAESLGIDPGFGNEELMEQVEEELDSGEVLHWAGRMCPDAMKGNTTILRIMGAAFCGVGLLVALIILAFVPGMGKLVALVPLFFVAIGAGLLFVLPKLIDKQMKRGWYAVTDQRAIVYRPSFFGSGGSAENYVPKDLRKMRIARSGDRGDLGDLVFKTKKGIVNGGPNSSRIEDVNFGFLGIENVGEVETLIHKVLLGADDDE